VRSCESTEDETVEGHESEGEGYLVTVEAEGSRIVSFKMGERMERAARMSIGQVVGRGSEGGLDGKDVGEMRSII
jgi:hypothetical protein